MKDGNNWTSIFCIQKQMRRRDVWMSLNAFCVYSYIVRERGNKYIIQGSNFC